MELKELVFPLADYGVDDPNYQTLPRGPKFIQQPNNTIFDDAQVNRYVHLRCEVDAVPSPQYTWLRQSENIYHPIDPKQDRRFILTAGTLTVMEPELVKDGGMYHCQAENNFGMVLSKPAALEFGCELALLFQIFFLSSFLSFTFLIISYLSSFFPFSFFL